MTRTQRLIATVLLGLSMGGCTNGVRPGVPPVPIPTPASVPSEASAPAPEQAPAVPESDGITREERAAIPPLPPREVRCEKSASGHVTLSWQGVGNERSHYIVLERTGDEEVWKVVALVAARAADTGSYAWTVPTPDSGAEYGVAAVSGDGLPSDIVRPQGP